MSDLPPLPPGFEPNTAGTIPAKARGKRVVVQLRNGSICGRDPVHSAAPSGWAADGKGGCRWSLKNGPFDIAAFKVL